MNEPERVEHVKCRCGHAIDEHDDLGCVVWQGCRCALTEDAAIRDALASRDARLAAVEAALDDRVTPTLGNAHWAVDPLPSCPNYSHVNPDWLLALITEARAIRAALHSDPSEESA